MVVAFGHGFRKRQRTVWKMNESASVSASPGGVQEAAGTYGGKTQTRLALDDLIDGLSRWWLWNAMAHQDILQRYRGSVLGPFWLTLSMAIMIAALGVLYSTLFKISLEGYLPFLCLGILTWTLLSSICLDGCNSFTAVDSIIKQIRIPFSVHIYRMVWRNLIIFGHNVVVYFFVVVIFGIWPTWATLLAIPGLVLVLVNGVWIGLVLGMICARFRDVPQIVASLVQVTFFVTPIIWKPELLGPYEGIAHLNPFMSFVDLIRAPLLGYPPHALSWLTAVAVTVAGWSFAFACFVRFRSRIPYWC